METLVTLTLIYAGVLVLALAVSLTAIWISLRRIAAALADARAALVTVGRETEPLGPYLEPLREAFEGGAGELVEARTRLAGADDRLSALLEWLGAVRLTR